MSPRRLAQLAILAAALSIPGAARAGIPVGMYPLRVPGLQSAQRAELHSLIEAGLASAARRGILQPRSPLLLQPSCGDVPAPECLAAESNGGVVLVGRGELKSGLILLTAAFYDRNGNRTREIRFVVDLIIQNLRPVGDAIAELEVEIEPDGTVFGAKKAPPAARDPNAPKAPILAGVPPPAPAAPKPPPAAKPTATKAPLDVSAPSRAVWKRQAGPVFTVIGAGLLAGGALVAMTNKSLSDDLDAKYAAGTLTQADRASYDAVQRKNVVSTVLLAAGGVSLAAGTYLWFTAPRKPGDVALAGAGGRF